MAGWLVVYSYGHSQSNDCRSRVSCFFLYMLHLLGGKQSLFSTQVDVKRHTALNRYRFKYFRSFDSFANKYWIFAGISNQTDGRPVRQTDRKNANVWQWLWTFFAIENPRFWHQDDCVFLSDARFWHCFGTLNWCLLHNQFTWHYHDVFCCFCCCSHLWVNCFQLDFYANLQDFKRNSNVVFCFCRTTIRIKS